MSATNLGNTSNSKYPTTITIGGGTVTVVQGTTPWIIAGNQTPGDAIANPTDALDTRTFNEVFNGTTWDRMREGTALGSVLVNNNVAANFQVTTTPAAGSTTVVLGNQTPADAVANPTDGLDTRTFPEVFNGTTWDRLREPTADAMPVTGLQAAPGMVFNGTTWDRIREGTATGSVLVSVTGTTTVVLGGQTTPTTSLNAQSTVQNGTVQDDGSMRTHHTIVVITSAGVSAGAATLQLSQDNTNWFTAVTINTTSATFVYSADVVGAFRYARATISTQITGGTITATIASV